MKRKGYYRLVCGSIGTFCVIIGLLLVLLLFMHGNKRIVNDEGEIYTTESMTCKCNGVLYPVFNYDYSKDKSIKISVVFSKNKLDTITLIAKLHYDDKKQIEYSSAENQAAMNRSFYADSMSADSFSAHYAYLEDAMQMTLYAKAGDLNGINAKYFLIKSVGSYTKEMLEEDYKNQGLNCVTREK